MRNRGKMPVSERAKQFAPFAAISGLEEALAAKELEHSSRARIEILEDAAEAINERLSSLYVGDVVEVTYYSHGHYKTVKGSVRDIDAHRRILVVGGTEIHFKDLYSIK